MVTQVQQYTFRHPHGFGFLSCDVVRRDLGILIDKHLSFMIMPAMFQVTKKTSRLLRQLFTNDFSTFQITFINITNLPVSTVTLSGDHNALRTSREGIWLQEI